MKPRSIALLFSIRALTTVTCCLLLTAPTVVNAQEVIYVDADAVGSNDGSSWANAFADLHSVLMASESGQEIWVAEGTYGVPNYEWPQLEATFYLRSGVTVLGGFSGTETDRSERYPLRHTTILSGHPAGGTALSVVTVVDADSSAILDGFTISHGNAAAGWSGHLEAKSGGGVFILNGSPILRNLVFVNNYAAVNGGAIANYGGNPLITDCTFLNNTAGTEHGDGGAISSRGGFLTVVNSRFQGNAARGYDNRLSGSGEGGAISIVDGGAAIVNSLFAHNETSGIPGAPRFRANGRAQGGAIYVSAGSTLWVTNSTFVENHLREDDIVDREGGGVYVSPAFQSTPAAAATIRNSIFWGNHTEEIFGEADVSHAIIEDGYPGVSISTRDPQLDSLFQFNVNSPAADAGLDDWLPSDSLDLDSDGDTLEPLPIDALGGRRIVGNAVDLGFYENQSVVPTDIDPDEFPTARLVSVYPNPASVVARISLNTSGIDPGSIVLRDALGRPVQIIFEGLGSLGQQAQGRRLWFSVEGLATGIYFLTITSSEGATVVPVAVVR